MSETLVTTESRPLSTSQVDDAMPTPARIGVLTFLCSEAVFFATLLIAYITYKGAAQHGPSPAESLNLPLAVLDSVFLLTSSITIGIAVRAWGRRNNAQFTMWMSLTIGLGVLFLCGTAFEWYQLIFHDGLTINRNLFGTTFFTLIGFHAAHVTIGLCVMGLLIWKARYAGMSESSEAPELVSWYWHLVDTVWIVIVAVVYW